MKISETNINLILHQDCNLLLHLATLSVSSLRLELVAYFVENKKETLKCLVLQLFALAIS